MKKRLDSLKGLTRLAPESHLRSLVSGVPFIPLAAYSPSNILAWIRNVGAYWFRKRYPFPLVLPETIFIPNNLRIAISGDWGSGTDEAFKVAEQITQSVPDYTIHLGDVYYIGNESEIDENFLGVKRSAFDPVCWPSGNLGTFSLCGNHEMFSNGTAFYTRLLPRLKQSTSFFRLENDNWIILGLDTAYNSTGLDLGPFKPKCSLPKPVISWLAQSSFPANKRVIVLTHHQPWSLFETSYPAAARQLAGFLKVPFIWIWGHEHRMAAYATFSGNGITATGFCAGHGGMPITVKKPDEGKCKLLFTDTRLYSNTDNMKVGYNGHMQLDLSGKQLIAKFIDLEGAVVYTASV